MKATNKTETITFSISDVIAISRDDINCVYLVGLERLGWVPVGKPSFEEIESGFNKYLGEI